VKLKSLSKRHFGLIPGETPCNIHPLPLAVQTSASAHDRRLKKEGINCKALIR
jgi:hypothetical protein